MRAIPIFLYLICLNTQVVVAQSCIPDSSKRRQVYNFASPFNFICEINIYKRKLRYSATASFVYQNILIGAGHTFKENLFSRIKYITITLGLHRENGINKWLYSKKFKRSELKLFKNRHFFDMINPAQDFAFVALPEKVSRCYFKLTDFDSLKTKTDSVFMAGYPGDKSYGEMWIKSEFPFAIMENKSYLLYSMYTCEGESGSPLWCEQNGSFYLFGVHVLGHYNNGKCNASTKINYKIDLLLQKFIRRNGI